MTQQVKSCSVAACKMRSLARSISGSVPPWGVGRMVMPKSIPTTKPSLALRQARWRGVVARSARGLRNDQSSKRATPDGRQRDQHRTLQDDRAALEIDSEDGS